MSRKKNTYKESEIRFVKSELKKHSRMIRPSSKSRSYSSVRRKARLKSELAGWIRSMLKRAKKRIPTALLQKGNIHSFIQYALRMKKMR